MGCPNRIYDMDESGMPLNHKPPKVVARKGTRKVHCRTSGNKSQITSGARVLTSADAIAMMEEKQRKKREEEAKEQWKREREEKKLQKEEEK